MSFATLLIGIFSLSFWYMSVRDFNEKNILSGWINLFLSALNAALFFSQI
jgi:hypothetical protein